MQVGGVTCRQSQVRHFLNFSHTQSPKYLLSLTWKNWRFASWDDWGKYTPVCRDLKHFENKAPHKPSTALSPAPPRAPEVTLLVQRISSALQPHFHSGGAGFKPRVCTARKGEEASAHPTAVGEDRGWPARSQRGTHTAESCEPGPRPPGKLTRHTRAPSSARLQPQAERSDGRQLWKRHKFQSNLRSPGADWRRWVYVGASLSQSESFGARLLADNLFLGPWTRSRSWKSYSKSSGDNLLH